MQLKGPMHREQNRTHMASMRASATFKLYTGRNTTEHIWQARELEAFQQTLHR